MCAFGRLWIFRFVHLWIFALVCSVKSFIPHGRHFTIQIMDGRVYIFSVLNIDLNSAYIVNYRDFPFSIPGFSGFSGFAGPRDVPARARKRGGYPLIRVGRRDSMIREKAIAMMMSIAGRVQASAYPQIDTLPRVKRAKQVAGMMPASVVLPAGSDDGFMKESPLVSGEVLLPASCSYQESGREGYMFYEFSL